MSPMGSLSMMKLSEFDKAKGRELMDKDNDGRCDFCGIPLAFTMDPKFYIPSIIIGVTLIGTSIYMWKKQRKCHCIIKKRKK